MAQLNSTNEGDEIVGWQPAQEIVIVEKLAEWQDGKMPELPKQDGALTFDFERITDDVIEAEEDKSAWVLTACAHRGHIAAIERAPNGGWQVVAKVGERSETIPVPAALDVFDLQRHYEVAIDRLLGEG